MNTKNSTSFLFKILAVALAAASCNAIQMVTGEKTKLGNFNRLGDDNHNGPMPMYVFFEDSSSRPYLLDTEGGYVGSMTTSATNARFFTLYDRYVFFKAFDSTSDLYRYDLENHSEQVHIASVSPNGIAEFEGRLYFVKSSDSSLCFLDAPGDTTETCVGIGNFDMADGLRADYATQTLWTCYNGTLGQIDTVNGTITFVDPDGAATNVPCTWDLKYHHSGKFVYTGGSVSVKVYDTTSNSYHEYGSYGSIQDVKISHTGNFYFESSGELIRMSLSDGGVETLLTSVAGIPSLMEAPDAYFYFNYNGVDGDELYRHPYNASEVPSQIGDLDAGSIGRYVAVGPEGFYLMHDSGIEQYRFHDEVQSNIYGGTVSGVLGTAPKY